MLRTGRILLVEPEEDLRTDIKVRLTAAGHDVAAVPDDGGAEVLLSEGLDPDVVLMRAGHSGVLRELAPQAVHVRLDAESAERAALQKGRRRDATGPVQPVGVLRRVEEALLEHGGPATETDGAWLALDLARRLANALPTTRTLEDRIELLTESFHTHFGVRGTLVIRRGPDPTEWIEVGQGLDDEVSAAISSEIARRAGHRDIRPFLARVRVGSAAHDVACLAVGRGDQETDLAMDLQNAPAEPGVREALMNLVGSALRAARRAARLQRAEGVIEAQLPVFENMLAMSREFSGVTQGGILSERILVAVRKHLGTTRGALFLGRKGREGMLAVRAVSGFSSVMLDRIGLSSFHGLGQAILEGDGLRRLSEIPSDGAALRESRMLAEAGLQWAVPLRIDERQRGILLFGTKETEARLGERDRRTLQALAGSACVALRNLDKLEELQNLSLGSLRGLAAAAEMNRPNWEGHAERVAHHAAAVGRRIGLSSEDLRQLSYCALLHDVGKIGIPADEPDDSAAMRKHPVLATRILSPAGPPPAVLQGVEQHHESWDGHGYPYGLRGTAIHLFARIVAIVDAFDRASTGGQDKTSAEEAMRRLERGAGVRFDPGLVAVFAGEAARGATRRDTPSREVSIEEIVGA